MSTADGDSVNGNVNDNVNDDNIIFTIRDTNV